MLSADQEKSTDVPAVLWGAYTFAWITYYAPSKLGLTICEYKLLNVASLILFNALYVSLSTGRLTHF